MHLHRFPRYQLSSPEGYEALGGHYCEVNGLSFVSRDGASLVVNGTTPGSVMVGYNRSSGHRVFLKDPDNHSLVSCLSGAIEIETEGVTLTLVSGQSALVGPCVRRTTTRPGTAGIMAAIPNGLLRGTKMPPGRNVCRDETGSAARAMRGYIAELDCRPGLTKESRLVRSWEALLVDSFVASLDGLAAQAPHAPTGALSLAHVVRAEEIMRAELGGPFSVVELAERLGVSARALQYAFERHRRAPPRQVMTQFRLDAARARLTRPMAGDSITGVSLDLGISNVGRFATAYRERFHELPSETLQRAALARVASRSGH
jgi:AraC-like DNA-binding protein